jgi:hypothetical protein
VTRHLDQSFGLRSAVDRRAGPSRPAGGSPRLAISDGQYNAFPHLFLSFSATFLGVMQAAYDGALAYLTGRMPGAPVPHTEIAAKGPAIAEMLFAIESTRAIYYRLTFPRKSGHRVTRISPLPAVG